MKKRIGILGIGGIGGYFGGLLAMNLEEDPSYEIIFIARGETKKALKKNGLILTSIDEKFVITPKLISEDPSEIGSLDLLVVCTKSYSMRNAAEGYISNIKPHGALLTLQNSVNQREEMAPVLRGDINHLIGCCYIISNITAPGHILRQKGPDRIAFGESKETHGKSKWVQAMFQEARIDSRYVSNIDEAIWNKYLFISPVATATSYFESPIGAVAGEEAKKSFLTNLIKEAKLLSDKLGVNTKAKIETEVLEICGRLNHDSKSSMQLDFEQGDQTELEGLTGYVLKESERYGLESIHYKQAYNKLKQI